MSAFKTHIIKRRWRYLLLLAGVLWYYFSLPNSLFDTPKSTVIESNNSALLGARIADDGQWRFPDIESVPYKFEQCIIQFEDAHFYKHPGFNPISIYHAFRQNVKAGKVVRGGSTLTQQVIRLSRKNHNRSYFEKLKELILATRLELRSSKQEILRLYTSNAPFGGNIVGLEAASWRYFGRASHNLSWAESATLAVLPNAPGLIYPGKNQGELLAKRNRLLKKLFQEEIIDHLTLQLSVAETLPQKPFPLPNGSQHLLQRIANSFKGERIQTSIDEELQQKTNDIVTRHYSELKQNEIYNAAVLVIDVKTRKVLSYVGNTPTDFTHQNMVDIIDKPRSTGSILKPFLYAAALDAGVITPEAFIEDVPTQIGRYKPINFDNNYDGLVKANEALSRSLNVPAVRLLQEVGLERFYDYLQKTEQNSINKGSNHYGLSIILGGAESTLWDLCKAYAALAGTVNFYDQSSGKYVSNSFAEPTIIGNENIDFGPILEERQVFDAGSSYLTLEALKGLKRPEGEGRWELFNSTKKVAWKTGTSHGFRDAWSIGVTKDYVVGVWVGNADGEGRPGLTGIRTAAPIMFDVFNELPSSNWFTQPFDELDEVDICITTGMRAGNWCEQTQKKHIQHAGLSTEPCKYHKLVNLDKNNKYQVNTTCEKLENITVKSWLTISPLQAYYYKKSHPDYQKLPPKRADCGFEESKQMEFIYPRSKSTIAVPKNFDEKVYGFVSEVVHINNQSTLYWYLDDLYIGTTKTIHQKELYASIGEHKITVSDSNGNKVSQRFDLVK
ncbi:penicillin-binding protein 1C [Urechidicola sp. KH5]